MCGVSSHGLEVVSHGDYLPASLLSTAARSGLYKSVKLGEMEVEYNTASQAVGTVNNVFDVYPWLQSYLGAYCLGGSGSYQVRVVRG